MLSLASGGKIANQKYRGDEGKKWDCKVFEEITGTKLFLFVLHLQKCGFKVPEGIDRGTCQREECLGLQYLSNLRGILHRYDSLCACWIIHDDVLMFTWIKYFGHLQTWCNGLTTDVLSDVHMMTDMTYVHIYTLVLTCWPSAAGHLDNTSHLTPHTWHSSVWRHESYGLQSHFTGVLHHHYCV